LANLCKTWFSLPVYFLFDKVSYKLRIDIIATFSNIVQVFNTQAVQVTIFVQMLFEKCAYLAMHLNVFCSIQSRDPQGF